MAGEVSIYFRTSAVGATGMGAASSLALIGAGHLMGITCGAAMLAGLVIAWGVLVPIMTVAHPAAAGVSVTDHALSVWSSDVRMMTAALSQLVCA